MRKKLARLTKNIWLNGIIIVFVLIIAVMAYFLLRRTIISPPVSATIERTDNLVKKGEQIQINILNGCGREGISRQVMDFMRARGFDVVEITNYDNFNVESSFVIDRVGDTLSAKKAGYAMGISDSLRSVDIDSTLYLRCSIVLGKDFGSLKPFAK